MTEPWTKIAERNDLALHVDASRVCKHPDLRKLPEKGTATFEFVDGMLYIKFDRPNSRD